MSALTNQMSPDHAEMRKLFIELSKALDSSSSLLEIEQNKTDAFAEKTIEHLARKLFSLQEENLRLRNELALQEQKNCLKKAQYQEEENELKKRIDG